MKHTPLGSIRVFKKQEIQSMDYEQRSFAQQQLRHIWSHEMSKVSASMAKREQVEKRLADLQMSQEHGLTTKLKSLTTKLTSVSNKRREHINKKIEAARMQDDLWRQKLIQVQKKIKAQDRQAQQKLKKYKEDYSDYLKKKELAASQIDAKRKEITVVPRHSSFYLQPPSHVQANVTRTRMTSLQRSRKLMSKTHIDTSIQVHQQKSKQQQLNKQEQVFQKVLGKLETIKTRRERLLKNSLHRSSSKSLHQATRSPKQSRANRSDSVQVARIRKDHSLKLRQAHSVKNSNSRVNFSRLERLSEVQAQKREREQQQFMRRGELLQGYEQRTKKQHIVKSIREKVTEFKLLAQRQHHI